MLKPASLALLLVFCVPLLGAEEAPRPRTLRFTPAAGTFACDIPAEGWHAFEEEEPTGYVVRLLGPDNPSGTYRTGVDIRWAEKGAPGFVPLKQALYDMRRSDKETRRSATSIRAMRVSGAMARVFEVTETRILPEESLPSREEELHHYVALLPSGESYFVIRLSSSRDVYLDYRDFFVDFLRSFRTLGYR